MRVLQVAARLAPAPSSGASWVHVEQQAVRYNDQLLSCLHANRSHFAPPEPAPTCASMLHMREVGRHELSHMLAADARLLMMRSTTTTATSSRAASMQTCKPILQRSGPLSVREYGVTHQDTQTHPAVGSVQLLLRLPLPPLLLSFARQRLRCQLDSKKWAICGPREWPITAELKAVKIAKQAISDPHM